MSGEAKSASRPLDPEELVLLGYFRMLVRDYGVDAGERLIAEIQAIVDRPVKRPRPALAFSAAVDADRAERR